VLEPPAFRLCRMLAVAIDMDLLDAEFCIQYRFVANGNLFVVAALAFAMIPADLLKVLEGLSVMVRFFSFFSSRDLGSLWRLLFVLFPSLCLSAL
jgi:hypothetical protein